MCHYLHRIEKYSAYRLLLGIYSTNRLRPERRSDMYHHRAADYATPVGMVPPCTSQSSGRQTALCVLQICHNVERKYRRCVERRCRSSTRRLLSMYTLRGLKMYLRSVLCRNITQDSVLPSRQPLHDISANMLAFATLLALVSASLPPVLAHGGVIAYSNGGNWYQGWYDTSSSSSSIPLTYVHIRAPYSPPSGQITIQRPWSS